MKIRYARVTRIEKDTALQTRRLPRVLMQDDIDMSATAGMMLLWLCSVSRITLFRCLTSNGQRLEPARGDA